MVYNKHKGRVRQILTKMNRKLITKILGASLVLVLTLVIAGSALARERENENESKSQGTVGWGEMKKLTESSVKDSAVGEAAVTIRANGDFRVSGVTVNSASSSSNVINVSFFGFTRDVNVSGAKIFGGGKEISLGDIQAGDKLNAFGNYNVSTRAITVYEIKNVTMRKNTSDIQARIQQLLEMIQKLQEQIRSRL